MCPWTHWQPAGIQFCEALVCGWVRQPANTYSNLGFVLVGLWIAWELRREKFQSLHLFSIASILIGITSALFHASMTFLFQFFDVSSMFMLILLCTSFNFARMEWIHEGKVMSTYLLLLIGSMLFMFLLQGTSGEWLFTFWLILTFILEIILYFRLTSRPNYTSFIGAVITFIIAFTIWVGDVKGWWCDPDNHYFQGHAIWHLLDALALYLLYYFYKPLFLQKKSS